MERKFEITLYAPLGKRHGVVEIYQTGTEISGTLDIIGSKSVFTGTIGTNGDIKVNGDISSKFISFSYVATGTVTDSNLKMQLTGGKYSFQITGKEIKGE